MQILHLIGIFYLASATIVFGVMNKTQNIGDTVFFTCQAVGEPVPNIIWYLNGVLVQNSTIKYMISELELSNTTINSTLTISNVDISDLGIYTCNATNVVSTDTSSGTLTSNGKLHINIHN